MKKMKKLLSIIAVLLMVFCMTIPVSGSGVWIPNSGSKNHRYSSCSNMRNPRNVSENQAISMGYTPCKKCY